MNTDIRKHIWTLTAKLSKCCLFYGLDTETDKLIYLSLVHCPTMSKFILLSITKDNKLPLFLFFLNWEWCNDISRIICFESNEVRLYTSLLSTVASCQIHPPDNVTGFIGWHILFASLQRISIFSSWVYRQIMYSQMKYNYMKTQGQKFELWE